MQGDQRYEMAGKAEFRDLHGRNFIGLVGNVDVRKHQLGVGRDRAQHLGRGAIIKLVEAASQRLAFQGDAGMQNL